jgi:uncharacterized membrane protein YkvA (DUF1232 family)
MISNTEDKQTALVKRGAAGVTEREVEKVVDRAEDIQRKFHSRGPLRRFVDDARLLLALVRDYWTGRYRRVPFGIIAAAVFALIYVLNPLDLMPDVLPFVGVIDDASVVGACLVLLERDLLAYRKQMETRPAPQLTIKE